MLREDARAALTLAVLAAGGLAVRWVVAPPPSRAPGDVRIEVGTPTHSSRLRETAARSAQLTRPLAPGERVDINRADAQELARLPRIGPKLAARILADRAARGPVQRFEDLERVPGIGPKILEAIRPYVAMSGVPAPPASLDTP